MLTIKSPTLLTENGLLLLDYEVRCNGVDFVKTATGIDLSDKNQLTSEEVKRLKDLEAGVTVGKISLHDKDCSYNQRTMKEIANLTVKGIFSLFIVTILIIAAALFSDKRNLQDLKDVIIYILGVLSAIAAQIYSY